MAYLSSEMCLTNGSLSKINSASYSEKAQLSMKIGIDALQKKEFFHFDVIINIMAKHPYVFIIGRKQKKS